MPYIHVDLSEFETTDLIDEVESRGLRVIDEDDSDAVSHKAADEIYDLYRDFVSWDNNQLPDNDFVLALKKFFENHTDKLVA